MFSNDYILQCLRDITDGVPVVIGGQETSFKIPILYIEKETIFPLSKTLVDDDLEVTSIMKTCLFNKSEDGKDSFFSDTIQSQWTGHITNNIPFLKDTQEIIKNMNQFTMEELDSEKLMAIREDTVENTYFFEKYNYIDSKFLSSINESSSSLQILSLLNVVSPFLSFILPFVIMAMTFIILKLQGIAISMEGYCSVLKTIAKKHFIGKMLFSHNNENGFSLSSVSTTLMAIGLYVFSMYQNYLSCHRYYQNIKKVNENLLFMREYIHTITTKMQLFLTLHRHRPTYHDFCKDVEHHIVTLDNFHQQLISLRPFQHTAYTASTMGYLLKQYYELKTNDVLDTSLRFSMGMEGYLQNMMAVSTNITEKKMNFAVFDTTIKSLHFKDSYYPIAANKKLVKNTVKINKNRIITGPNASGKTTLIKSTLLNIIFSQQFGCGFYRKGSINPFEFVHSYLNIPDTSGRDSLFQAESRRCKEILTMVDACPRARHFCIFDELYSGTNTEEATKASIAYLTYLNKYENVTYLLTTHYLDVCDAFEKQKKSKVGNYKMEVTRENDVLNYSYKMVDGISRVQGGFSILREMNYPEEIIQSCKE